MKKRSIVPRKIGIELDSNIPMYWCDNRAFMTQMLNTYTLLIPDNESYYIRHLRKCADDLTDEDLLQSMHSFCRQEAQHGIEHKAYWKNLESQGIRYKGFVKCVGWFNYKLLEPVIPKNLHLANIACIEHANAYIGALFLERNLLVNSDPRMKFLFSWHFAEEIEHKSVAFDVYQHICGSYPIRVLSAFLVFPLFYLINTSGTFYLLWQDRKFFRIDTWKDFARFLFKDGALYHTAKNIFLYLKPGFNPSQIDDYNLAENFLSDAQKNQLIKEFPVSR